MIDFKKSIQKNPGRLGVDLWFGVLCFQCQSSSSNFKSAGFGSTAVWSWFPNTYFQKVNTYFTANFLFSSQSVAFGSVAGTVVSAESVVTCFECIVASGGGTVDA